MAHLDDELREALENAEAQAPVTRDLAPERAQPKGQRSLALLAALLVIGGGLLLLVFTGFSEDAVYSRGVDQLLDERAQLEQRISAGASEDAEAAKDEKRRLLSRNTRVMGMLVKGTLMRREQPCEYRFDIENGGKRLSVRYAQCVVPDTFRDMPDMDVEVTVTGKLQEAGHFEADQIMAKCPSKYEMQERAKQGELAPHAPISGSSNPAGYSNAGY